jgi:hypothetical protein
VWFDPPNASTGHEDGQDWNTKNAMNDGAHGIAATVVHKLSLLGASRDAKTYRSRSVAERWLSVPEALLWPTVVADNQPQGQLSASNTILGKIYS